MIRTFTIYLHKIVLMMGGDWNKEKKLLDSIIYAINIYLSLSMIILFKEISLIAQA